MSETGSDFDGTDATDSPFECLSDGNGNNGKGIRHVDTDAAATVITDHFVVPNRPPVHALHKDPRHEVRTHAQHYQGTAAPSLQHVSLQSMSPQHQQPPLFQRPAEVVDAEMTPVTLSSATSEEQQSVSLATEPESPTTTSSPGSSSTAAGGEEDSILSWISSGSGSFLSRVAEKAKNSVDTVITTLDPGMKEYLYSGGGVSIVVASDKECKVSPIREAFIDVFGRATVKGISSSGSTPDPVVAAQPIGTQAALLSASERIAFIRKHLTNDVPQNQVIISLENFLIEMSPGSWYDMGCLFLDDPLSGLKLVTYTQSTPVPAEAITSLKFETPADYAFRETGFNKTIGHFMQEKLSIPHEAWHEAVVGMPRRSIVYMAACALAKMFKDRLAR